MVNRRGPSNINLGIFVPLMFTRLYSGFITIPLFGDDSSQRWLFFLSVISPVVG